MSTNAFINHPAEPTDDELTAAIGPTRALWDKLVNDLAAELDVTIQEWYSYSTKAGWSMRLKHKKRNIVYLCPCSGYFFVSFALGGKAIQAAKDTKFPQRIYKIIEEAPQYAEGTAVRMDVKKPQDVEIVKKLAAIKLKF